MNTSHACCTYPALVPLCCPDRNHDIDLRKNHYYDGNMASFSSRGPTHDGRTRPDVVCPGLNIWSAYSHGQRKESTKDNCNDDLKAPDASMKSMAGTSMATPVCAGNIALLSEYLRRGFIHDGTPNPVYAIDPIPAALLKAIVINGAVPLDGLYEDVAIQMVYSKWISLALMKTPNQFEGYGRVNLMNSVPHMDKNRANFNVLIARSSVKPSASDTMAVDTSILDGQNVMAMCFTVVCV